MDIYNLFVSKDVREYLRKIGYKFSTEEAAFLVYVNGGMTIKQKHAAWQEIIDTMPNCSLGERLNMKAIPDFHEFLRKYMKLQNRLIDEFYCGENYVWQYEFACDDDCDFCGDNGIFATFSDCMNAIEAEIDDMSNTGHPIRRIQIIKQPFAQTNDYVYKAILTLDGNKQPVDFDPFPLKGEDDDIYMAFDGMWFDFPTPFKRGDIVVSEYGPLGHKFGEKEIFVLDSLITWDEKEGVKRGCKQEQCKGWDKTVERMKDHGDISDMIACGYFLTDDGNVYSECMHAYYNLEFYRGELKNEKRTLAALSSYIKGEIGIEQLMNIYRIVLQQKDATERIKCLGMYDETLKQLGLK